MQENLFSSISRFENSNLPVAQTVGVDLDETGAVYKDFWAHVAGGDELCPVLQPLVCLFQDPQQRLALAGA